MDLEKTSGKLSFLIVGAGPAGLVLGTELLRQGHTVTVLEREEGAFRPVCGEYLSPQGVEYLEALELGHLLKGFRPVWGMVLGSPSGRQQRARFPEGRHGVSLNRKEFQVRLMQAYLASGGRLFLGEAVTGIESEGKDYLVRTSKGEHRSQAVIGADGRSSAVAKFAGLPHASAKNPRVAVHVYLKPKRPLPLYGMMHILTDGCYAGTNPVGADEANFSIVADAALLQKFGGAKNLLNHHLDRHPALQSFFFPVTEEKIKTTFPIHCHREKIVKGKIALIGDASGFIDPLTGEGITTAIKSAALLAEKIRESAKLEEAFALYARDRKTAYRQKENLNRALQWIIRRPGLCETIAVALRLSSGLRYRFIGVIGNIYTPLGALMKFRLSSFHKGGPIHGQNHPSALRFSPPPALPSRSHWPTQDRLARARSRARSP